MRRATLYMLTGLVIVSVFSDPVVECMEALGDCLGIDPFYVAFFLAPIASNAEELVVTYNYAQKKTRETYTIAVNAVQGCSCMNTTFCLFVFLIVLSFNDEFMWN